MTMQPGAPHNKETDWDVTNTSWFWTFYSSQWPLCTQRTSMLALLVPSVGHHSCIQKSCNTSGYSTGFPFPYVNTYPTYWHHLAIPQSYPVAFSDLLPHIATHINLMQQVSHKCKTRTLQFLQLQLSSLSTIWKLSLFLQKQIMIYPWFQQRLFKQPITTDSMLVLQSLHHIQDMKKHPYENNLVSYQFRREIQIP